MSDIDLDAIEARAKAATEGPWESHGQGVRAVASVAFCSDGFAYSVRGPQQRISGHDATQNACFIAHAREDVPALTAEVRALRAQLASAREANKATLDRLEARDADARAAIEARDVAWARVDEAKAEREIGRAHV